MKDELMDRVQNALDRGEGISTDDSLATDLEAAAPEVRAEAEAVGQIDAVLRAWPAATLGEQAAEALANRIEQRLDEELSRIDDPTEPPPFDDDDADADGGAEVLGVAPAEAAPTPKAPAPDASQERKDGQGGGFSLANLTSLSVRDMAPVQPNAPLKRPAQKHRSDTTQPFDLEEAVSVPPVGPAGPPTVPPAPAPKAYEPTGERASIPSQPSVDLGGATRSAADLPPAPIDLAERRRRNRVIFYLGSAFAAAAALTLAVVSVDEEEPAANMALRSNSMMEPETTTVSPAPPTGAAAAELIPADLPEPSEDREGGIAEASGAAEPVRESANDLEENVRRRQGGQPSSTSHGAPAPTEQRARPRGSRMGSGMAAAAPSMTKAAPDRADVTRALRAIQPAVSACANGRTGVVTVNITVASSGRVRNAVVQGEFAGTREGSCVARAVRGARFSPFEQDSFSIRYPFRF